MRAYSYIRFSSEQQATGDSLRRQTEAAAQYANAHNLALNTSTYQDLGVSAYKSRNKVEGALGMFLKAVDEGIIPPGSFLLVENFDRLSRDHVDIALELMLGLTRRGITIVTLQDRQTYSKESIRENWVKLVTALAIMARANEESQTKSKRIKAAWDKKRTSGGILTGMCPSWLKREGDKFIINEAKANVVRRIFQMAYDGHGSPTIAKTFNEEGVPTMQFATNWTFGPVHALLKNKSVVGYMVPKKAIAEEIPNYYPAIIEPDLFWEVQKRVQGRRWLGGRNTGNVRNLFSGLSFCHCGSQMRSVGADSKHSYVMCLSSYSGAGCDAKRFPYLPVEKCLMNFWMNGQGRILWSRQNFRINPKIALEGEKAEIEKKIANLTEAIEQGGNIRSLAQRVTALEEELDVIKQKLAEPEPGMSKEAVLEAGQLFEKYKDVLEGGTDTERVEWRTKAQASIRRFLKRVEFHTNHKVVLTYASGTVREMSVKDFMEPRGFQPGNSRGKRVTVPSSSS